MSAAPQAACRCRRNSPCQVGDVPWGIPASSPSMHIPPARRVVLQARTPSAYRRKREACAGWPLRSYFLRHFGQLVNREASHKPCLSPGHRFILMRKGERRTGRPQGKVQPKPNHIRHRQESAVDASYMAVSRARPGLTQSMCEWAKGRRKNASVLIKYIRQVLCGVRLAPQTLAEH